MERGRSGIESHSDSAPRSGWLGCLVGTGAVVALSVGLLAAGMIRALRSGRHASPRSDSQIKVLVGVPPVGWLVEQIGGEQVTVQVAVPAGADPHTYSPSPQEAMALVDADLAVFTGLPLEERLREQFLVNGSGKVILSLGPSATLEHVLETPSEHRPHSPPDKLPGDLQAHRSESTASEHSPGGSAREFDGELAEHAHAHEDEIRSDPHVWLAPRLLRVHARQITRQLARLDPQHAALYESRLKSLEERIDETDRCVAQRLAPHRGKTFYVFHPAFGHFAAAYGLRQRAVQWPGGAASPRDLHELIAEARAQNARIILVQPQFDPRPAQVVADAVGAALVEADPLAPDVLANLSTLAEKIAAGFEQAERQPGAGGRLESHTQETSGYDASPVR